MIFGKEHTDTLDELQNLSMIYEKLGNKTETKKLEKILNKNWKLWNKSPNPNFWKIIK